MTEITPLEALHKHYQNKIDALEATIGLQKFIIQEFEEELSPKQKERRDLVREVALKCIKYSEDEGDFICYTITAETIADDILSLLEDYSKGSK